MRADGFLRSIEGDAIAWLRRLVDVNSFTHHRAGVLRNADLIEEMFQPLGFAARRVRSESFDCGDHLVLKRGGPGAVVMVSHLDTVYPPDTDFAWREEGDRIFGPGACDIKGGTVLMWMVLRALQEERAPFTLLFNATEEGGCADFPALARAEAAGARACLVYEPGFPAADGAQTIAVRRKGSARFRVRVAGREAHSGHAHASGANAVRELARLVERLEAMTDPARDVTLNVGVVRGGTMVNVVPAEAEAFVDLRAWNTADYDAGRAAVLALAGPGTVTSRDGCHRCTVSIEEQPAYPPWPENEASAGLGALAVECGAALGLTLVAPPRAGGSDGCHLWDLVPTLDGLGPIGRNPHCSVHAPAQGREQESVERSSFVPRALLSLALIGRILGP